MKKILTFGLVSLVPAAFLGGCVSMTALEPNPAANQALNYYSGAGTMTSNLQNCSVVFGPLDEVQNVKNLTTFGIAVTNRTMQPILVDPENVTAVAVRGKESKLTVVDRNKLVTQVERERAQAVFGAAMYAASSAVAASMPSTTTGTVRGGGQTYFYNGTTTNPAASAAASQAGAANAMAMSNTANAQYAAGMAARVEMIAKNTVVPGDTYSALVKVLPPGGSAFFRSSPAAYRVNVRFPRFS